jgi:hypothetical protein
VPPTSAGGAAQVSPARKGWVPVATTLERRRRGTSRKPRAQKNRDTPNPFTRHNFLNFLQTTHLTPIVKKKPKIVLDNLFTSLYH